MILALPFGLVLFAVYWLFFRNKNQSITVGNGGGLAGQLGSALGFSGTGSGGSGTVSTDGAVSNPGIVVNNAGAAAVQPNLLSFIQPLASAVNSLFSSNGILSGIGGAFSNFFSNNTGQNISQTNGENPEDSPDNPTNQLLNQINTNANAVKGFGDLSENAPNGLSETDFNGYDTNDAAFGGNVFNNYGEGFGVEPLGGYIGGITPNTNGTFSFTNEGLPIGDTIEPLQGNVPIAADFGSVANAGDFSNQINLPTGSDSSADNYSADFNESGF